MHVARPTSARIRDGLFLVCALAFAACGGKEPRRPNVLLISLDSTRRDALSVYGYRSQEAPDELNTPHLEALAADGVVMENAYSTSSWTLPSHVSMLTGEPELVHAVDLEYQRPDSTLPYLPEILHEIGYHTAGYFSGPYLEASYGFARGFDSYESRYGVEVGAATEAARAAREALRKAQASGFKDEIAAAAKAVAKASRIQQEFARSTLSSEQVTDAILAEFEASAKSSQPFFLFAHYFDPHYDYVPPAPYDTLFDPNYDGAIAVSDFLSNPALSLPDEGTPFRRQRIVSERDLVHVRALYAGEIAWTDAQLGRLFDKLEELDLAEDTLVIVTANHGTEFFEHQNLGQRSTLFEELVRVPMILRFPTRLPAGQRVQGLVSTIDLMATVLELLGVSAPAASSSKSFAKLAAGEDDGAPRHVLGRIVRLAAGKVRLTDGAGDELSVAAARLSLLETYREGPLKITRERNWAVPTESLSAERLEAFHEQSSAWRSVESLRWIDVEAHPDELAADHSESFEDERTTLALRRFRERYRGLLSRRGGASLAAGGVRALQVSALDVFGYASASLSAVLSAGAVKDLFVFPPPGE